MEKKRKLIFAEGHFREFFRSQVTQVQNKIIWTFRLLEHQDRIPEPYLKHLSGTNGLYEIRIQCGGNSFRIFCFFVKNDLVIGHAFQKKTDKIPQREIERAEKIKKVYYEKNATNQPR
jgi:phage-related protein